MSDTSKECPVFLDEYQTPPENVMAFQRLRRITRFYQGWVMGEVYDDRYDTEVGGVERVILQPVDDHGFIIADKKPEEVFRTRRPRIFDCLTGDCFDLEEAKSMPELAGVVIRLEERIAEYEDYLAKGKSNHDEQNT